MGAFPRTVLAAFALAAILAAPARARYQGTEYIPRDWVIDEDFFINALSFGDRALYKETWERSHNGYRIVAGSTHNNELHTIEQLRVTVGLHPRFNLRFQYEQAQDFDEKRRRFDVVGITPLWGGLSLVYQGEVRSRKEWADIGAGLMWRGARPATYVSAVATSVDHWFTDKNDLNAAIEHSLDRIWNLRLTASLGFARDSYAVFDLEAEPDFAIRFGDLGYTFRMRKYVARGTLVHNFHGWTAAKRPAILRVEYLHENTRKTYDTFLAADPQRGGLDRQVNRISAELEIPLAGDYGPPPHRGASSLLGMRHVAEAFPGPRPRPAPAADAPGLRERSVRFGVWAMLFDEDSEFLNDPTRELVIDYRDAIFYAGYVHGFTPRWTLDASLFLGFVDFEERRGAVLHESDHPQVKTGLGFAYIFSPSARVVGNITQDLDAGEFGGGNVRFLLTF